MLLAQDIATAKVRDLIRREVWDTLVWLGFATPPPPDKPGRKKSSHLRTVGGSDQSSCRNRNSATSCAGRIEIPSGNNAARWQ